jgi:hydroxymethylglutaryl-CoA reductase (NADPH)
MPNSHSRIMRTLGNIVREENWQENLRPDLSVEPSPHVPQGRDWEAVARRWELLGTPELMRENLLPEEALQGRRGDAPALIENFIGHVAVPVGLAGPLRVNGTQAHGDFYVPMATIEPTLIATYNRGAQVITMSGGATAVVIDEGVIRSPGFTFRSVVDAVTFTTWISEHFDLVKMIAESTTKYGKLLDMKVQITGRHVHLIFEYSPGDAIGQNMVTIATHAVLQQIKIHSPVQPEFSTLDANMSGDKKPSVQTFQSVRGRKVVAETVIPREICETRLNTTPEALRKYMEVAYVGGINSGTIGMQGHYANGLTALYLACGQDAACAAESGVGITSFDITKEGDFYASVTLPNIMVGSVGAMLKLPGQRTCLELLGVQGPGGSTKLAEIAASLCLAGDISMLAALSVDEFAGAHQRLARQQHAAPPQVEMAAAA